MYGISTVQKSPYKITWKPKCMSNSHSGSLTGLYLSRLSTTFKSKLGYRTTCLLSLSLALCALFTAHSNEQNLYRHKVIVRCSWEWRDDLQGKPCGDYLGYPLKIPNCHTLWLSVVPGWCPLPPPHQYGGWDPVAPLDATTDAQDNRPSPFFPIPDYYVPRNFGIIPLWLWCEMVT